MKRWLVSVCLLAVGFILSAQTPVIRILNEDQLSSGVYRGGSIDILYTAPASYKLTLFVNGVRQKGASFK